MRQELVTTGNLLVDALELERHFARRCARNSSVEVTAELKTCRRTVKQLVQDYARSMARYRKAVRASFPRPLAAKR